MLDFEAERPDGAQRTPGRFVLYLEGPADRGVLQGWCRRLLPSMARRLSGSAVILGGRRPARALEHFRALGGAASGARAICLLDRDDGATSPDEACGEPGLRIITWGRRHIESYLLVPDAIRKGLRLAASDTRVLRLLRDHLPPEGDEDAWRSLNAKRFLGPGGPLARALGTPIPLARVARATDPSELHADVHGFFDELRPELGVVEPTVVR